MAPYLTALSQQPEFRGVSFVRVDLEACAVRVVPAAARARAVSARRSLTHVRAAAQALGAKNAVLSAPTYHFYRKGAPRRCAPLAAPISDAAGRLSSGALLDSFSGALPHKLMELLGKHKGDAPAQRGGLKLLALLVAVSAGVAAALVFGAQPAPPPPPPPPPQTRTDEDDREPPAAPLADEGDPQRRVAPAKKAAGEPSKGAQMA
jgi:hypothetical protein